MSQKNTGELAVMVLYSPDNRPAMPCAGGGGGEGSSRKKVARAKDGKSNLDQGKQQQRSGGGHGGALSHTVVVFLIDLEVSPATALPSASVTKKPSSASRNRNYSAGLIVVVSDVNTPSTNPSAPPASSLR